MEEYLGRWPCHTRFPRCSRQTSGGSSKPQCHEKPLEAEAIFFPVLEEIPRNLIWKEVVLTKCLWIAHSTNREAETVQVNFELLVSVQFCISVEFSRKGSEKSAGNSQPHPVAHTFGEVKDCKSIKEEDECMKSGFSKDSKDGWKRWLLDGMFLSRHRGNNLMAWDGDIRISQSLSMLENLAVLPL